MTHQLLSRRTFLRTTAVGAGAAALPLGGALPAAADGGVVSAPVVIATLAAAKILSDLLAGINNALTTSAQVHARTASGGPDADDPGSRATSDLVNTFLETDLRAWTTRDTGGLTLGPNQGSAHTGYAHMHLNYTGGAWTVTRRYASANPRDDTTPVAGADNTTAVASVGTFAHNGAIVKSFQISDADDSAAFAQGRGATVRVAPAPGDEDLTCRSSAALMWSVGSFVLSPAGDDLVRIVHPDDGRRLNVFHTAVQREGSPRYRSRYDAGLDPLLTAELTIPEAETDASLGITPLDRGGRVDLTLTGLDVRFRPLELPREGRTDLELVQAYLASPGAMALMAPLDAQTGYAVPELPMLPVGAGMGIPAGTLLAEEGGYGTPDPDLGEDETFDDSDIVGVVWEMTGSLTDAVNRAIAQGGNATADEVSALSPGDPYELSCTFCGGASTQVVNREMNTAGGTPFERIFGATPADTAMFVAQRFFEQAPAVFFATEADFPDALAGAAAAGLLRAPILFVQRDQVPDATFVALEQLAPQQGFILGGPVAISEQVEATLAELIGRQQVQRIAGRTRYETAVEIARQFFPQGAPWHVATGEAFPDALAGAAAAARSQGPIVLVRENSIPDEVMQLMEQLQPEGVFLLGGPAAISEQVEQQFAELTQVFRVAGDSRFSTASQIARGAFPEAQEAFLVPGGSFHEALVASPIAGAAGAPVLLSPGPAVGPEALDAMNDLGVGRVTLISVGEALHPGLEDQLGLHGPC